MSDYQMLTSSGLFPASNIIQDIIKQGIIKEHLTKRPVPWVFNAVNAPKVDVFIRVALDACNVNKAILLTNHPIPCH